MGSSVVVTGSPEDGGHLHEHVVRQGGDGGHSAMLGPNFSSASGWGWPKPKYTAVADLLVKGPLALLGLDIAHLGGGGEHAVVQAVAAMDRASISTTPDSWPSPGLDPSRLGKFRVVWRMDRPLLAGTSPAPKQGPQKQEA